MTIYSTKVSAHYIARRQAAQAGGSPVNFLAGTVIVGDGNGAVPAVSDLVTAGGVLHEVWRGQVVVAVNVDEGSAAQIDIRCVIPAVIGGTEVGPFWVREFVITDEAGVVCVYGTTALEKTTSAQGQISDLSWIAAIGESDASVVVLSPPSSNFVTQSDMQSAINAHQPTAEEPIYASDTVSPSGWLQRLLRIRRADPTKIGVERPASDAEFAAGAGSTSPWPWPTLAQVKGALAALQEAISARHPAALAPLSYNAGADRYELDASVGHGASDNGIWAFTPESGVEYTRSFSFEAPNNGVVLAMTWWVIAYGQLPSGTNPDGGSGMTIRVLINGQEFFGDNTLVPAMEAGAAHVSKGDTVTVQSFLRAPTVSLQSFPPISQHLSYLFVPTA